MTLLSICQDVAHECGLNPAPSTIAANVNDETASRLFALARRAGKELADRNWTALQTEYTFTLVSGIAAYALPSDFGRFLDGTLWDRSQYRELRGPTSPQAWQRIKSGILTSGPRRRFRVMGHATTTFNIYPTPTTSGDTLVFEYASKNWCQSAALAAQSDWAADADTAFLDEQLIISDLLWRMLHSLGMDYADEKRQALSKIDRAFARDGGAPTLSLAPRQESFLISPANIPDSGFGT